MYTSFIEESDPIVLQQQWLRLSFLENSLLPLAKQLISSPAPTIWLCHAWPSTSLEEQQGALVRFLWLTRALEAAGINVQHELQLSTLQAARANLSDTQTVASTHRWWENYVADTLRSTPVVWLLGGDSYYAATAQAGHPLHKAHQRIIEQSIKAVPLMWAGEGNFMQCVPERYKQVLMADVRSPEKILTELPVLLEKLLRLGDSSAWKKAIKDYRALTEAKSASNQLTPEALKQLWQTHVQSYSNELDKRLDYCPVAIRVILDGLWQQQRQRVIQHWQKTIFTQPPFTTSEAAEQPELTIPSTGEVVAVIGAQQQGKRDYLLALAKKAAKAIDRFYGEGMPKADQEDDQSALLGPSLPLWVDLTQYDLDDEDLLDTVLQQQGISSKSTRDFMKRYQPLLILADRAQEAQLSYNLYTHQNWRDAQVALAIHCHAPYLSSDHPDIDYYFMPDDAQGLPVRERLHYATYPTRRLSADAVEMRKRRERLLSIQAETTDAVFGKKSTSVIKPTATAAETAFDLALARRFVQRERHRPALQHLAQQLQGLQDELPRNAFISYAWPRDKESCSALQQRLQQLVADSALIGLNVLLDIEQLQLGTDIKAFMEAGIAKSDVVFLIGTPDLVDRVKFDEKDQPVTNAAFEFAEIQKKIQEKGRVFRLTHLPHVKEGQAAAEMPYPIYTQDWPSSSSPVFDLVAVNDYYASLPTLWLSLLNLTEHPTAQQFIADYQRSYQVREAGIGEADIQASIQQAREAALQAQQAAALAAEQAERQRAEFESALQAQLELSRKERFLRIVDGLRLNTEALQPNGFIANTLKQYIPTQASTEADPERAKETAADLKIELDRLRPQSVTLVVGNSGSGKSLALHAHAKAAWARYDKDPDHQPLPIFLNLPQYRGSEDWLTQALSAAGCDSPEELTLFREQNPSLQVYCDGLDELPITTLTSQRFAQVFRDYTTTLIVSCRQEPLAQIEKALQKPLLQYVLDGWDLQGSSSLQYYVTPFTRQQISSYLRTIVTLPNNACYQQDPQMLEQKIHAMPSLMQLIENPFVLNLVCQALPRLESLRLTQTQQGDSALKPVSRVEVFNAFLQEWFTKGLWRQLRQEGISPNPSATSQWQAQAQAWAMRMFANKTTRMDSRQAYQEAGCEDSTQGLKKEAVLRKALPIREYQGQLAFIHKSVQECFIAQTYLQALNASDFKKTLTHWNHYPHLLQEEGVLFFIKDGFNANQAAVLWKVIAASKGNPRVCVAASLAITVLNYARVPFSGKDLSGVHIPGADMSGAICDATDFSGADLSGVRWKGAYLRDARFGKSDWTDSDLGEAPYWAAHRSGITGLSVAQETEPAALVSASQDESWIIWRAGAIQERHYAHAGTISHIAFHPHGTEVISAGLDGAVKHWVNGSMRCYWQTPEENIKAMAVDFTQHCIFLSSPLRIWALDYAQVDSNEMSSQPLIMKTLAFAPKWQRQDESVAHTTQTLAVDSAQNMVWAGQSQGQLTLLHGASGEIIQTWSLTQEPIVSLALASQGPWLALGTQPGTIILWDIQQSAVLHQLTAHAGSVNSLAFEPHATRLSLLTLASAGADGTVCLWSCSEGNRLKQWTGHRDAVTCLVFMPNGEQLISGSLDRTIRTWALTQSTDRHLESSSQIPLVQLVNFPHQPFVLAIDQKGHCVVWHADSGQRWGEWPVQLPPVRYLATRPSDTGLRLVSLDAMQATLAKEGGQEAQTPLFTPSSHTAAVFSPEGNWLIAGNAQGDIQILSSQPQANTSAAQQAPIPAHTTTVLSLVWQSPERLITADASGAIMGWDWHPHSEHPQLRLRWTTKAQLTASGAEFHTTLNLRPEQIELLGQRGGVSPAMIQIGLRAALLTHDVAEVQRCLTRYPDLIQQPLEDQKTPWQIACQYSPLPIILACIHTPGFGVEKARATILDPSTQESDHNPLWLALQDNAWAATFGLCQALTITLDELRALAWQDKKRHIPELTRTLAQAATRWNGTSVVEQLLLLGVDPEFPTPDGLTPLMHAARSGCEPGVRILLQYGADPLAQDPAGNTALLHAASHGKTQLVKQLFINPASINKAGEDALVRAARFGHADTVHFLLSPDAQGCYDAHRAIRTVLEQGKAHQRYRPQTILAIRVLGATLSHLNLRSSRLEKEGAELLAQGLRDNATITHLDLHNNRLCGAGGHEIAAMLPTLANLQHLNIRSNFLGDEGATALWDALEKRTVSFQPASTLMLRLDMRDNQISEPLLLQFRETAARVGVTEYYDLYNDPDEDAPLIFRPRVPTRQNVGELLSQSGMYRPRPTLRGQPSALQAKNEDRSGCRPTFGGKG